jgi:lipoprotein-releasing system ATP-binding protein
MNSRHIEIRGAIKQYGKVRALNNATVTFERGGQYAVTGASGSGKSTLLYLIGGLDRADQGEVFVDGKELGSLGDEALATYRGHEVGFVFQFHFLLNSLNCRDNILLPAKISGAQVKKVSEHTEGLAKQLGVENLLEKFPYQLSGGEQQRVNLIRALSLKPKLLLCDEPTGNLDSHNTELVVNLLSDLALEQGSTLIIVTHDQNVASRFSHQVRMRDGSIID